VSRRTDRINGLLRQEISQLLSRDLNDPRLSGVVSITRVETSADLRVSKVYVSVLGGPDDKVSVLKGISSAGGFIRREMRDRLSLKYIPDLRFTLDESMEEAQHIQRLMDRLSGQEDERGATAPGPASKGPSSDE
jgi:ribosome-binding factor A